MRLLIDIGNTSAKIAVADYHTIIRHFRLSQPWQQTFSQLCQEFNFDICVISNVAAHDEALCQALQMLPCRVEWLTAKMPCPAKNIANVPAELGADRWAADIAALSADAVHPLLVIDAGTCVTYDIITADGQLAGGSISPGVQLRLKAMHEHTSLLPMLTIKPDYVVPFPGTDTDTSMFSGAYYGVQFEIEGYIRLLMNQYPDLRVFLTGGNAFRFSPDIEQRVVHNPQLVLDGLNAVADYLLAQ